MRRAAHTSRRLRFRAPLQPGHLQRAGVQEALQDQHRRHLVDDALAPDSGVTHVIQTAMCLRGRQAFVPQVYGETRVFAERVREGLSFRCLRTKVAAHVQWIARNDLRHAMPADEPGQALQILAECGALQRQQRLSRKTLEA